MVEFDPPPSAARLALAVGLQLALTGIAVALIVSGYPARPVQVVLGLVCLAVNTLVVWR